MRRWTSKSPPPPSVAIVGAGPAGLRAAEIVSAGGVAVTLWDHMPSVGRKFLMAGRGGLNLTHAEPLAAVLARYGAATDRLAPLIRAFPPEAVQAWAARLGQTTFVGTSGRVFPTAMKASPLLRTWLAVLRAQGVEIRTGFDWTGWNDDGALCFQGPRQERQTVKAEATVLALGGASWPKLGSTGAWAKILAEAGVEITPFQPANGGFAADWSPAFRQRFAGSPLKTVALTFDGHTARGEVIITAQGVEGGPVYALGARLRDALSMDGQADLLIDIRPDLTEAVLTERLARSRGSESVSNHLRKAGLTPLATNLLREIAGIVLPSDPAVLAKLIKSAPLRLIRASPLERSISTAGGVAFDALEADLMLKDRPGVFVAGEMLDWEAPTGGYLLQGCLSTGTAAGLGALAWVRS